MTMNSGCDGPCSFAPAATVKAGGATMERVADLLAAGRDYVPVGKGAEVSEVEVSFEPRKVHRCPQAMGDDS